MKKKRAKLKKIKVLKVEPMTPDLHRINLELEVSGAEIPATITPEQAVEITPGDEKPQIAATGWWERFLKGLW
jgi:hypothetical protein